MIREEVVTYVEVRRDTPAYRSGWEDGRFGQLAGMASNANLDPWMDHDRLAYYRGHREGRRVRDLLGGSAQTA